MAKIISVGHRGHHLEWELSFQNKDDPSSGYGFPCDSGGTVNTVGMAFQGLENLGKCLSGELNVTPAQIRKIEWSFWEPGVIVCDRCHRQVTLDDSFANSCGCGLEYDGSGNRLAPRSQWGDEWVTQPDEDRGIYTPDYSDGDSRQEDD